MLPDVALLEIFDSYVGRARIDAWYTLVHVCQKWRNVVFGSPRRLDLLLYCVARTPVRKTLDVWPPLPIAVWVNGYEMGGMDDNVFAALEHNDRISHLDFSDISSSQSEKVLAAMQQPFPTLIHLVLHAVNETTTVDPASFLGGSAPGLQTLSLERISFPGLPKLLLSATHLVYLYLWSIPYSGYISPEAMVTCLSMLTRLRSLVIEFESPRSRPDRNSRRPPPPTRTLLPVLSLLSFRGVSEYLEDFVARFDAPLLDDWEITFFHQLIFDTPQLSQSIRHSPKSKAYDEARVIFSDQVVSVTLPQTFDKELKLGISCRQSDWQLSSLAQVCGSSFPQVFIPAVEHLYILEKGLPRLLWQDDIENGQWLELFHPFTAVKGLYISHEFTPRIVPALQELVGERVTEVLPALQTLFLEEPHPSGPIQEAIVQFVAARQLACHPIAVSLWEREKDESSYASDDN
jgi:hypothetical protein